MFARKRDAAAVAYAVEACGRCGAENRRRFRSGDCLFCESGRCSSCGTAMTVQKIFGEAT